VLARHSPGKVGEDHYWIHPFFSTFLERRDKGSAKSWTAAHELHQAAFERLDELVNKTFDDEVSYRGWGELEDPERQSLIANWIYQLAFLEDRRQAAEAYARLYLKAHWWWGAYIPFNFCEFLVHLGNKALSWSEDHSDDDLFAEVVERIQEVHRNYSKSGRFLDPPMPGDASERWAVVEDSLCQVGKLLDIPIRPDLSQVRSWEPEVPPGKAATVHRERLRDLSKFLHIFLAHCELRSPHVARLLDDNVLQAIEGHYACALWLARQQNDNWNQPWILYELGDVERLAAQVRATAEGPIERGTVRSNQIAEVSVNLAQATARCQGEDPKELDFEILALCQRALGELFWPTDKPRAIDRLMRAVHYAHCFEVWPDNQPDAYTLHFERDQRFVVVRLLYSVDDQAVARMLVERVADFFGNDVFEGVWALWQKERGRISQVAEGRVRRSPRVIRELEHLANVLFEAGPSNAAGYHLAPHHGVFSSDPWLRRLEEEETVVEMFRHEAVREIRRLEQRHRDLVRLPAVMDDYLGDL
jgi:hypothetical protein